MPAYSFKERFVPYVKDRSKPGTIRAARKQGCFKELMFEWFPKSHDLPFLGNYILWGATLNQVIAQVK